MTETLRSLYSGGGEVLLSDVLKLLTKNKVEEKKSDFKEDKNWIDMKLV